MAGLDSISDMEGFNKATHIKVTNAKGIFSKGYGEYIILAMLYHAKNVGHLIEN
jgi:phosphoglycerate dehydrogenase-like enzyme